MLKFVFYIDFRMDKESISETIIAAWMFAPVIFIILIGCTKKFTQSESLKRA